MDNFSLKDLGEEFEWVRDGVMIDDRGGFATGHGTNSFAIANLTQIASLPQKNGKDSCGMLI